MKRIKPCTPPEAYALSRSRNESYKDFSYHKEIRIALWEQQGGLCAYCERKIRHPDHEAHNTRIEHFHPQNCNSWDKSCSFSTGAKSASDSETYWSNLLLCCDGNELAKEDYSCDKLKGGMHVCGSFRNPKTTAMESLVEVSTDGKVSPVPSMPVGSQEILETVLNLNSSRFVDARKEIIRAWKSRTALLYKQHKVTKKDIIGKLISESESAEFGSTLLSIAGRMK